MSSDRSTVEAVVQHYFDALYDGDADTLAAIFHPSADLRSLEKGELQVLTVPDWLAACARAAGQGRRQAARGLHRHHRPFRRPTAFIKVRCQLPPRYFTDYLVAMKLKTAGRSSRNHTATICETNRSVAYPPEDTSRRRIHDALGDEDRALARLAPSDAAVRGAPRMRTPSDHPSSGPRHRRRPPPPPRMAKIASDHPQHDRGMKQGLRRRLEIGDAQERVGEIAVTLRQVQLADVPVDEPHLRRARPLRPAGAADHCRRRYPRAYR